VISFYDLGRETLRTFSRGLPIKTIGEGASGASAIYSHYVISVIDLYCFHVGLLARYHRFWQARFLWDNLNISKVWRL